MSISVSKSTAGFQQLLVLLRMISLLSAQLKRLLTSCLVCFLVATLWISTSTFAWADTTGELFEVHCAGCHPNGANIIRRGKNLKQKALKRHGYDSADAISTLITNGKGLMSAYGDRLNEDEINSLANYVLEKAAVNWKPAE